MKKLLVFFAMLFAAAPVFAQAAQSVASDDCFVFPKSGKKFACLSQDGNTIVLTMTAVVEGGGRIIAPKGVTAGGTSYFGVGETSDAVLAVSPSAAVMRTGSLSMISAKGIMRSFPLMATEGKSVFQSTDWISTSDQGTAQVALPDGFQLISNLNPATKGSYDVVVYFENGGIAVVPTEDKFPDHYVVRSKSGKTERCLPTVYATGDGFKATHGLHIAPNEEESENPLKLEENARVRDRRQ
jgi:hypothetical protein